jgi:hypothetical protein
MSDNPYSLRFNIWQEAKQGLLDQFYNDYEVWNNWQFDENATGECPVAERPVFPTTEAIRNEAEKIYEFVQKKN